MNTSRIPSFTLRAFRYSGDSDHDSSFSATLAMGTRAIARINGALGAGGEIEVEPLDDFYWGEFRRVANQTVEAREQGQSESPESALILEMADEQYHARRLQVTSLRHTAFRLRGDAPGSFRYLRGRPYCLEVEGQLRLTYGRRLEEVFRRGPGAQVLGAS